MKAIRGLTGLPATMLLAGSLAAQGLPNPLPLKYVGPPTVPAITAGDLMTRLYKYADDSMMGRDVGSRYHLMATAYIEGEVRRLGLVPGGDDGGYFQNIHTYAQAFDTTSTMRVDGVTFKGGADFLANARGTVGRVENAPVLIWGGTVLDTLQAPDAAAAEGKLVYIKPLLALPPGFDQAAFVRSKGYQNFVTMQRVAAGFIAVVGDQLPAAQVAAAVDLAEAPVQIESNGSGPGKVTLVVTNRTFDAMLGVPAASVPAGFVGKPVSLDVRFIDGARPGRNVVAILPGSDPKLKGEYIAIGAHNDHVGFARGSRGESDSLKIWGEFAHPAGAEGGRNLKTNPITPDEWATINAEIADLRKVYPPRPDSIFNGADDDGSGTVSVLEIAEAFARGNIKPKRSILFVWHAGEEHGMWGSSYFMDHPTVPRDSIVAQLNIDMIGRGAATDVTGQAKGPTDSAGNVTGPGAELHGGDHYLQLVGSRRLSTELGDLVEKVNTEKKHGFVFDYSIDANGHQQNIYCRSDHWSYAKWGVPVVFFTTGGHADYHQPTDEPQYIQYNHMAAVDSLIFDIAVAAANLDHRVIVDHAKPNPVPATSCKQ